MSLHGITIIINNHLNVTVNDNLEDLVCAAEEYLGEN